MSEVSLAESAELKLDSKHKDSQQNGLLSMTFMLKQYSESDFPMPRYMETLRNLILEQFQRLTSSQEDSPAKTSAMLERELASRGVVLHYGNIMPKRLGFYDPNTHSLKTYQQSLAGDSMLSLQTLPRSGMMRNGIVYHLPPLVRFTAETEYSLSPTPTSRDGRSKGKQRWDIKNIPKNFPKPTVMDSVHRNMENFKENIIYQKNGKPRLLVNGKNGSMKLANLVQISKFPTPQASDWKNKNQSRDYTLGNKKHLFATPNASDAVGSHGGGQGRSLRTDVSGQLNPPWVEWLMGFPIGWTELSASETQSFHKLQKSLARRLKSKKQTPSASTPHLTVENNLNYQTDV
jgi:hypothetical protein